MIIKDEFAVTKEDADVSNAIVGELVGKFIYLNMLIIYSFNERVWSGPQKNEEQTY